MIHDRYHHWNERLKRDYQNKGRQTRFNPWIHWKRNKVRNIEEDSCGIGNKWRHPKSSNKLARYTSSNSWLKYIFETHIAIMKTVHTKYLNSKNKNKNKNRKIIQINPLGMYDMDELETSNTWV